MRSEVIDVCKREWDIIYAVFPDAIHVMQVFLQRIFAQSVKYQIKMILDVLCSWSLSLSLFHFLSQPFLYVCNSYCHFL